MNAKHSNFNPLRYLAPLKALLTGPKTAHEINSECPDLSESAVYQALRGLRDTKTVEAGISENKDGLLVIHYKITEKGRAVVPALETVIDAFRSAENNNNRSPPS